uniref:Uncharacterized protein n=1 Tax=Cucumis sativus TaxID=3659 RepID=A0A0A0L0V9_CUCSA
MKVTDESSGGEVDDELVDSLKAIVKRKVGLALEIKVDTKVQVNMRWLKMSKVGLRKHCDEIMMVVSTRVRRRQGLLHGPRMQRGGF